MDRDGNVGWIDQYAFVGPALFEMREFPHDVKMVCSAVTGMPAEHQEVWCPINQTWVRLDGTWVTGWSGIVHFAFRPTFWNRLKIRMAARAWRKMQGKA